MSTKAKKAAGKAWDKRKREKQRWRPFDPVRIASKQKKHEERSQIAKKAAKKARRTKKRTGK